MKSAFRWGKHGRQILLLVLRRLYEGKLNSLCDIFCGFKELINIICSVAVERRYADCAFKSEGFYDSLGIRACIQTLKYGNAML